MKKAIITGASRGIGKAIALQLGRDGYQVYGTATTQSGADAITQNLSEFGGQGYALSLGEPDSESQIKQLITEVGQVHTLVHNAGVSVDSLIMRLKEDEWRSVVDVSLTSFYLLAKACVRSMLKQKDGRIVGVSSVIARLGNPGQTHYAAAKAGMEGMTRSLAWEVSSRGVTVNTVAPGFIETDMTQQMPEEHRNVLLSRTASQKFGQPSDIAHAVSFLCSEKANFITGTTLSVNGGLLMC